MKRCQVLYRGDVQGVGFRWTARRISRLFDVTGWVRNLSTGEVELIAVGEEREIHAFLKAIRDSELGTGISDVSTQWTEQEEPLDGFTIRF